MIEDIALAIVALSLPIMLLVKEIVRQANLSNVFLSEQNKVTDFARSTSLARAMLE